MISLSSNKHTQSCYNRNPLAGWKQYALVIVATATLILSNYWLMHQFNLIYRVFFICLFPLCLIENNARSSFLTRPGFGILLFACILGLMYIADHGDRVASSFSNLLKNMPFFAVGYFLSDRQFIFRRFVLAPILAIYSILGIQYARAVYGMDVSSRLEAAKLFTDDARSMVVSLITHFPIMVLLFFLSLTMLSEKNKSLRLVSIFFAFLLLIQIFFAFWTAPLIMLTMGSIVAVVQFYCNRRFTVWYKFYCTFFLGSLVFIVNIFLELMGRSGQAGVRVLDRAFGLITAPFQTNIFATLDYYTASRLTRALYSWDVFTNNLFFGYGDYSWSGAGGHSLWFDSLAKYGLIGAFPLFFFAITVLFFSLRNYKAVNSEWVDFALMLFMTTWYFSAFLNPYLFGRPGYFIFLALGMVTGRNKLLYPSSSHNLGRKALFPIDKALNSLVNS